MVWCLIVDKECSCTSAVCRCPLCAQRGRLAGGVSEPVPKRQRKTEHWGHQRMEVRMPTSCTCAVKTGVLLGLFRRSCGRLKVGLRDAGKGPGTAPVTALDVSGLSGSPKGRHRARRRSRGWVGVHLRSAERCIMRGCSLRQPTLTKHDVAENYPELGEGSPPLRLPQRALRRGRRHYADCAEDYVFPASRRTRP